MPHFREGSLPVFFFFFLFFCIHNPQPQYFTKEKNNATDLTIHLVVSCHRPVTGHELVTPGSPFTIIKYIFTVRKAVSFRYTVLKIRVYDWITALELAGNHQIWTYMATIFLQGPCPDPLIWLFFSTGRLFHVLMESKVYYYILICNSQDLHSSRFDFSVVITMYHH